MDYMKFKVLFYQKEDGTEPAKVFLNSLDKKMRAKMVRTIETLQNNANIIETLSVMTPSEIATTLEGMTLQEAVYARQTLDPVKRAEVIIEEGMLAARGKYNEFFKNFREHAGEHTNAVTEYALKIARESGLDLNISEIEYASKFHDLGMRGGYIEFSGGYIKDIIEKASKLDNKNQYVYHAK